MAISYNTGTTAGANNAASLNITIPAGVLAGDVVFLVVDGFSETTGAALSIANAGPTSFTQLGQSPQLSSGGGIFVVGGAYYIVAAAGDAGKVVTITTTATAGTSWISAAIAAYTGASGTTPVDTSNGAEAQGSNATATCPVLSTGVNGDWAVYLGGGGLTGGGATLAGPATTTQRENFQTSGISVGIFDSNGSVGNAPASIGGGTFASSGSGTTWMFAYTVGLAPPAGAAPKPENPTPPRIPTPLFWDLVEVAAYRTSVAPSVASPVAQTWRLMDGAHGRPGVGSSGAQPPSAATANVGNLVSGTTFYVTQPGMWFQGYWWWVTSTGSQPTTPQKFALWTCTGSGGNVVPGTVVTSGTLSPGWNFVPLAQPVQLSLYGIYLAATGVNGPFPATTGQTASGDPYSAGWSNGPLVAPSDANGSNELPYSYGNGVVSTAGTDPSLVQPNGDSNGGDIYWLDVQVSNTAPASYNGSYRLWPNNADADFQTGIDAAVNYVLGTEFTLSQSCVINAIWYYVAAGQGGSGNQWATSADIWRVGDGVRVATQANPVWIKPFTGGIDGQSNSGRWVYTQLPGTVTLPPGDYRVSVYNGNGSPNAWSAKRLGYWQANGAPPGTTFQTAVPATGGITNGPLYAPTTPAASSTVDFTTSAVEPGQSVFQVGPPNQFPNLYVGQPSNLFQNYWIDVEVTPASTYQADAPDLPQRIPHPLWTRLLTVAAERKFPGSNAPSVSGSVTGAAAALTLAAPAGTVDADGTVTGATAGIVFAAPAGSVSADGTITGVTATVTLTAAAGSAAAGASVTGVAATLALAAPAGSAVAGDIVSGTTAGLTLTAPAGSVTASSSVTGSPAALALAAPAGAAVEGDIVAGTAAGLTLTAPAGSVEADSTVTGAVARLTIAAIAGTAGTGIPSLTPGTVTITDQATAAVTVTNQAVGSVTIGNST